MVMPVMVIGLLLPTMDVAKVPLMFANDIVTTSSVTTPESAADEVTS